jgi:hypothetical protein
MENYFNEQRQANGGENGAPVTANAEDVDMIE